MSPEFLSSDHLDQNVIQSNDRYSSLLNILKGFEEFILNSNGVIISSNLEAVNITGYEEWEIIGKHLSIFYSPEDQLKDKPNEDLRKAARNGFMVSSGLRLKKRNTSFWAKIRIKTITDETGYVTGFKMVMQDATHRAISNLRSQTLRDEYLSIFNNPFVGIVKFRVYDNKVLMVNDKASSILRINVDQNLNSRFFESEFNEFKTKLVSAKRIENHIMRYRTPDDSGFERDAWVSMNFKYFESGSFAEGIVLDVSKQKDQINELERLRHELDQFIYHASHDLRAPLASMLGIVNLIEKHSQNTEDVSAYSGMLKGRINHLDQLLRSIVAIAYNNSTALSDETVDLNEQIHSLLKEFEPEYSTKTSFQLKGDSILVTDKTRLGIVLRNILSNAFKFSRTSDSEGKDVKLIRIEAQVTYQKALIKISDQGVGIAPEYLQKIFDMFSKGDSHYRGMGLGLYIVKSMIEKLGGSIFVESKLNIGSSFTIEIPNRSR